MRLILRILGTWLLGLSLILLIIDGTRSLANSTLVFTSFGESWASINAASLETVRAFIATRFFGPLLDPVIGAVFAAPGFLVLAVPGVILAVMGRSRRVRVFVRQDQT
jgi:hypothetical protein